MMRVNKGRVSLIGLVLAALVLIPCGRPQPPPAEVVHQAGKLVLHQPVERELGPGQTDLFTVDVAAGQFLHVAVEKRGVDVVLEFADPEGKPLVTAPNTFGPSPASLIANRGGAYEIRVAKSPRTAETGRYRIELIELHAPTEADRDRLQAETEFFAAVANARDKKKWVQAMDGFQRAAELWHSMHDDGEQALCLQRIGLIYHDLGEQEKALGYYNRALPLERSVGYRAAEASTLHNIANVYSILGEKQKALDYSNQALPLMRAVGDPASVAVTLSTIGLVYSILGEKQKALDYSNQALPLMRAVGNRSGEANTLNNIATVYSTLGEQQKGLDYYNQALPLMQAVGNRAGEASTLHHIANVYSILGEKQKALDYYNRALSLERAVGYREGEAGTLADIGLVYATLGEKQKALDYYNQAGEVYLKLGEKDKALQLAREALKIDSQSTEASVLLWAISRSQLMEMSHAHRWDEVKETLDQLSQMYSSDAQLKVLLRDAVAMINAEGQNSLKQSKWDEAAAEFKLSVLTKKTPDASRGLDLAQLHSANDAGIAAFDNHQYGRARDNFEAVLKFQARFDSSADQKSLALLFANARAKFRQSNNELVLQGAIDQYNGGQYKTSHAIVEDVLKTDPSNNRALTLLRSLGRAEDIDKAVASGQLRLANHDWENALQDFKMALRLDENDTRAKTGQQQAQTALDQRKRNIMVASAAAASILLVILAPTARRARVYARFGWTGRSAHLLEKILERNPGRVDAVILLSALYSSAGQQPSAVSLCTRYLAMKPNDLNVLRVLADCHYQLRDFDNARAVYQQILPLDSANATACSRLIEMEDHPGGDDECALKIYEPALRANPESVCLNRLVARCYMRQRHRSRESLNVLNKALAAEPGNSALQLAIAEICWEQGLFKEVMVHAGAAFDEDTDNPRALFLLLGAGKKSGRLADCLALVDSGKVSGLRAISVCEEIAALQPALRPMVHERYERFLQGTPAPTERNLYSSHICIDKGSMSEALTHLKVAVSTDYTSSMKALCERELARALCRFLEAHRAKADYPQAYADVLFRLGELYRGHNPRSALGVFKEIVKLPEWQVRSTAAMQDILDGLRVERVATIFFEDVGWNSLLNGSRTQGFSDLTVSPPASTPKLHAMIGNCKVRCFAKPITLDDVVQLNRELADQAVVNREFTFVVSTLRVRQDVLALIYALLTEQPSLRVIPLEAVSLKQAIIEGKSADALEQLLRLWLGQGDLFDVHSPIADAGTFFGRGQFIHTLTTKIIHRENFGIFGLRKVGKTSLVFQLRENLPQNLIGYTDLQSISSRRCDEIYFRLSAAVRRELRVKFPDVPAIPSRLTDFDPSGNYPSIATDFHNEMLKIKEALESQGQQPRVLLLLDEIELLLPSEQSKGFLGFEDFFRQIRGLYQQEGFILSGVVGADPNACRAGKWGDLDNPIFQYYDEIFLSPLDRSECDQMVQGIGEVMGIAFDSDSLTSIFEESGGHPYVGRQLCSRIVSRHNQRPLKVTREVVDEGIEDYIAQRPDYFIGVFRGYVSTEARKLLEVTASNDENEVSRAELMAFSVKAGLERSSFDRALQDLELFHLLSREKDRYHIKIRLLRRWIRRSWLGIE